MKMLVSALAAVLRVLAAPALAAEVLPAKNAAAPV